MKYEPLKDVLWGLMQVMPCTRKLFYRLLDMLLLRQRYVKRAIKKHAADKRYLHVYDAGAGYGQYSWHILQNWNQSRVFALDLKADYLMDFAGWLEEEMRSRFSYAQGDLQVYEPKNQYDMALAIDILEHIPDDMAVLSRIHSCLKAGGKLIISTPSDTDEAAKFTAEHVRPGYSMAEIIGKLEKTGFHIVESYYSYGVWGSLAWRLSIKYPLMLLAKSKIYILLLPFYYLPVLPFTSLFNWLDTRLKNPSGTGIILVAQKQG